MNAQRRTKQKPWLGGDRLIHLILALLCLCGALYFFVDARMKLDSWTHTQGIVLKYESRTSTGAKGKRRTSHYPVFRFTAAKGESCTVRNPASFSRHAYSRGEQVEVIYPAEAPQKAEIASLWGLYHWSIVLTGLGAVFSTLFFFPHFTPRHS